MVFNGFGLKIRTNQQIYAAEYNDHMIDGIGRYCQADGHTYKGYLYDGKSNGKGESSFLYNRSAFIGEYKDDKRNGYGKYSWDTGLYY